MAGYHSRQDSCSVISVNVCAPVCVCAHLNKQKKGSEGDPLYVVSIVVYGCRHWRLWRSQRNPPNHLRLCFLPHALLNPLGTWLHACLHVCARANVCAPQASFHLQTWIRWDTTVWEAQYLQLSQRLRAHISRCLFLPLCNLWCPMQTHTYTTGSRHIQRPGLADSYSPQSYMKEGNHQSNHSHDQNTVIIRLRFSLPPSFAPSKHGGVGERQLPGGRYIIIQSQDKRVRGK